MRFLSALVLGTLSLVLWKFSPQHDGVLQAFADATLFFGGCVALSYCLFSAVLHTILVIDETDKRNKFKRDFRNRGK